MRRNRTTQLLKKRSRVALATGTRRIRSAFQAVARFSYKKVCRNKQAWKWAALTAAGLVLVIMADGCLRATYYNFADPQIPKSLYYKANSDRYAPSDRIPEATRQAVVAMEDHRFGSRLFGLPTCKELWRGLVVRPLQLRVPWIPETLEAQTAKLTSVWGTEPPRLLKPVFRAIEALQAAPYSILLADKRILGMYLNMIPVDRHVYGIRDGAWHYFRKKPHQLTRNEAAVLLAKLPAPFAWKLSGNRHVKKRIQRATGYTNAQYKKRIMPLLRRAEANRKAIRDAHKKKRKKG